jgi:hypothetical protein
MKTYFFAFGADMDMAELDLQQDRRRRPRLRFAKNTPAVLKGFKLICDIESKKWRGGIFNVVPDPAGKVYGVRYELHPGDTITVASLKEGHAAKYGLSLFPLETMSGERTPALLLHAVPEKKLLQASPAYLEVVVKAAKAHKLPAEWIAYLSTFANPA